VRQTVQATESANRSGAPEGIPDGRSANGRQIEERNAHGRAAPRRVDPFVYPAGPEGLGGPVWGAWSESEDGESGPQPEARGSGLQKPDAGQAAGFEQRLQEETRRFFEAGRERGHLEARQAGHEAQAAIEQQRARQAAQLIENFAEERDRYLRAVEREVVELALAVAARILRREAQMDPLLLTGAVRVALGQLAGSTEVRLRVPAAELELWRETVALLPKLAMKPTVLAGENMRLGECVIETELGTVDLGIRAQLGEIERGFFDRAGRAQAEAADAQAEPARPQPAGAGRGMRT
jgi:flagellar assembly protein FliH